MTVDVKAEFGGQEPTVRAATHGARRVERSQSKVVNVEPLLGEALELLGFGRDAAHLRAAGKQGRLTTVSCKQNENKRKFCTTSR